MNSYSSQCRGTTKQGSLCKNRTRSESGLCLVHSVSDKFVKHPRKLIGTLSAIVVVGAAIGAWVSAAEDSLSIVDRLRVVPTALVDESVTVPVAGKDEILVLVSRFDDRSEGNLGIDITPRIMAQLKEHTHDTARVEILPNSVADEGEALALVDRYDASAIIWGWSDKLGLQSNITMDSPEGPRSVSPGPIETGLGIKAEPTVEFVYGRYEPSRVAFMTLCLLGLAHFKPGYYDVAASWFSRAISMDASTLQIADLWIAYEYRATCRYYLGNMADAIVDFNEALTLNPTTEISLNNRGLALAELGDHAAAVEDLSEAIRLSPDSADAFYSRGTVHDMVDNYQAAIDDYSESIRLRPDFADAFNNRGLAYSYTGNHEAAINDFNSALQLTSDKARIYFHRGMAISKTGDWERAFADIAESISLRPDYAEAYSGRGDIYVELGKHEEAIFEYTEAIRLRPDIGETFGKRGYLYSMTGDYQAAIADYSEAIRLLPKNAVLYYGRGEAHLRLLHLEAAIADNSIAISLDPKFTKAFNNRGAAKVLTDDYSGAVADLSEAIRIGPADAQGYINRGVAYKSWGLHLEGVGDRKTAEQLWHKALIDLERALLLPHDKDLDENARGTRESIESLVQNKTP
jgi:tetratricopeptide (TPR) repeat protein